MFLLKMHAPTHDHYPSFSFHACMTCLFYFYQLESYIVTWNIHTFYHQQYPSYMHDVLDMFN